MPEESRTVAIDLLTDALVSAGEGRSLSAAGCAPAIIDALTTHVLDVARAEAAGRAAMTTAVENCARARAPLTHEERVRVLRAVAVLLEVAVSPC
jgi:hypothetical protein